ncbi:MAG: globin [Actinobacteria bacterium]|jgi:hemoglobin|nr:globin [Actinomycetota bacterium]NCV82148.1 globin [Actinomycetota bacterium]NCW43584.1 globin [Actinomycetota bacterium]NCW71991.1 globin [Actinomycetota bacterium]NCW92590.1 globin [Actinomycetota bacterium]
MSSFYEEIGGEAFFADLTAQFYAQVAVDPILRPMYPESDLKAAAKRLQWFLEQYWGGPTTYQENRGHPRLRMRHAQFHINLAAHDAWLSAMRTAVDGVEMKPEHKEQLWGYLEMAAAAMINQPD